MLTRTGVASLLCWLVAVPAFAQVVQLPTFHQFSISTTVEVPDSGSSVIGGVDRGSESMTFNGRTGRLGHREMESSRVGVKARITDFDELDRSVLSKAGSPTEPSLVSRKAASIGRGIHAGARDTAPTGSVAQLRRQYAQKQQLARQKAQQEAQALLARGDRAAREGKTGPARVYYQNAIRRADEPLQRAIKLRLDQLATTK